MNDSKRNLNITYVWKSLVFLFAFICCGFLFNSLKINAAHFVAVPDKAIVRDEVSGEVKSFTVYVGFDAMAVNSVKFTFSSGKTWSVSGNIVETKKSEWSSKDVAVTIHNEKYRSETSEYNAAASSSSICSSMGITCTDIIVAYNVKKLSSFDISSDFSIDVNAANTTFLVGWKSSASKSIVYDNKAPSVSSISVSKAGSASGGLLGVNQKIKFNVVLSESSKVSSGVKLGFSINGVSKSVVCDTSNKTSSFSCTYTISSGDGGNNDFERKISNVKLTAANNIKDVNGNAMASTVTGGFSFNDNYNVRIDADKPVISSIDAQAGVYSSASSIKMVFSFSETLSASSGYSAPIVNVKFGAGNTKTCSFLEVKENKLVYACTPSSTDQGVLSFVSISGGNGISDSAKNIIDLTVATKSFSDTVANNNIPSIDDIVVEPENCKVNGNEHYCATGKKVKITFKFNMYVTINSKSISIKFGNASAKNTFVSSFDSTKNSLEVVYTIADNDSGEMSLQYSFSLTGNNGQSNSISASKNDCGIYVDNKAPVIDSLQAYIEEKQIDKKLVYSKPGVKIEFKVYVNEISSISLNSSEIVVLDEFNNEISVNSNVSYGISSVNSTVKENVVYVTVTIVGECEISFKLKLNKSSIVDAFGTSMSNDYYSDLYKVNTKTPSFTVELVYPEYRSYYLNNTRTLISGNSIEFKVASNDADLQDYCVVKATSESCDEFNKLVLGDKYLYNFENKGSGNYSFYVRVRDTSLNVKDVLVEFVYKNIFTYSNGNVKVAKNHKITIDVSMFSRMTTLKYAWFAKNSSVSFNNATVVSKDNDSIVVDGNDMNGEYRLCLNNADNGDILCSEYVTFDSKIDLFEVKVPAEWSNGSLPVSIEYKDFSIIKCIAIGKDEPNVNCERAVNSNVVIYRTNQLSSPFNLYSINQNGIYYFYIEDSVGNTKLITKTISSIDKESIQINVYNGQVGQYNTNLEIEYYKTAHSFLITFDKDSNVGSKHVLYKYFFSTNNYAGIKSRNAFDSYYLNSLYREEISNCTKSLKISTPSVDGVYNLYIMAIDQAGNESFKTINEIKVDASGPIIKLYNSNGIETNGGSTSYIAVFDYSVVIEDKDSKLNLNTIKYKWVDSSNNVIVEKTYDSCSFYSNVCKISGNEIAFDSGVFSPNEKYRFVVSATDNAGNSSTFTSNSFMIDTIAPIVNIVVDENKWYENGDISFSVTKNNTGTLDTIAYCLNECFANNSYDFSKFKIISFTNGRVVEQSVSLSLVSGLNSFYVYASDIFGNYVYESKTIKYDNQASLVTVNNLNQYNVVDFTGIDEDELNLDITIKDDISGVGRYCIYYKEDSSNKDCFNHNGEKIVSKLYNINKNGIYVVEVVDIALNTIAYEVNVIGVDTSPIEFDLVRDVKVGQYVNGNVTISLVNMRKFMVNDVEERVASIDYVKLAYDSIISGYEEIFNNYVVNSIYNKASSNNLVTSFIATENKAYVVRVVDTAGNVSYNHIKINCIDKDSPFINTNKYPNNAERIYVNTSSGKNLRIFVKDDGVSKVYKYSNDVINVYFGSDSLKDLFTGYNDYLGLKVCFEDVDCVYNTYSVNSSVVDGYLTNSSLIVNAPYNFSGVIRYYLVDGAGNESVSYSFEVEYQNEVSEIEIAINDDSGNPISDVKKYSKINVVLSGDEINDIIFNNSIKYALVNSNINLHNQLVNYDGSISSFFTTYNFSSVVSSTFEVSKANDEGEYYLWIYIVDLLGNVKLIKGTSLIRLDTIAPTFGEISLNINKIDNTNYDISINHFVDGYSLYLDSNNDGVYEMLNFVNHKASFSVSGLDNVNFKLVDEANNFIIQSFSLNISSGAYARVYQVGNTRELNVVVYNLGNKNVTSFRYIVDSVNSSKIYDENTINDDTITVCNGYGDEICKSTITNYVEKGVYNLNLTSFGKDKKVVLYIYVDGNLIDIVKKDVLVDNEKPVITYKEENPAVISTVNGNNYKFKIEVNDDNISNLFDKKYILTTQYNVTSFDFEYNSCLNMDTCSRGLFNLNSSEGVIVINSNFNKLVSGTYYLYVYVEDDFGNGQIGRSSAIYVDNDTPTIKYANSNAMNTYYEIIDEVYVGGAIKLKITDNYKVNYFKVYEEGALATVCYIENSKLDTNCVRNSYGATGLVFENGEAYYYLDNGNYSVKVYDYASNVKEVYIYVDAENPVINLYKEVEGSYLPQLESGKIYSDLANLYVNINDENFYYLTIDLRNTVTNNNITMASRYSYNSEIGKCLVDTSICEYGVSLVSMIEGNTFNYNSIVIKVYDRANRSSTFEINYDDSTPEIWTLDEGESVYISGVLYTLESNNIVNVEIGVNPNLTIDLLLSKIVLSVDGMSYYQAKNTEFFKVEYFKNGNLFDNDLCKYIGNYEVKLSYMDIAGNEAVSKVIKVNVVDNTKPVFKVLDEERVFELREEVFVEGVEVKDNYGLKEQNGYIIKEFYMELSDASCFVKNSINDVVCTSQVVKVSDGVYKFNELGTYKFVYTIVDLAGNSSTIDVEIVVVDNLGPQMSSSVDNKNSFVLYFGDKNNNNVNIDSITLNYPNSFDKGDQENKSVEYVGLFGINNMGEKYRINDIYLISNANNVITYKFTKTGIYYLRFSSVDKSGNVSLFEYEVKAQDIIAPTITGVINNQTIKLGIEESFSVEYLIDKYSIVANDNYDSNVKIYYELKKSTAHSHEILLTAKDSSSNTINVTFYVDIEDYTAPEVGELVLDSITNELKHEFVIVGGSDNSGNWWHEYSVQGGTWSKIVENSYLEFGVNLSQNVQVCIKAVDAAGNISLNQSCKTILVDTKAPIINGINDGDISLGEVQVSVTDERLDMVEVWYEGSLISSSNGSEAFKFVDVGSYQIVARDTLGNVAVSSFMISVDTHVDIVTDINAEEYTTNTIEFDDRFLVRVDISYDNNGYSNIYAKIDNVNIKANDMLYILGVIPGTDSAFVIFSVNGVNIGNYSSGINLIGNGNVFKQGINNEDCFIKFNDYYYAYAIVKENASKDPVAVVDDNKNSKGNDGLLKGLFIAIGSVALLFVGYQFVKFRKKVRAA